MTTTTMSTAEHCEHPHHHAHDDDVKSFVFRSDRPFNPAKLEDFLGAIVQVYGPKMLRYKGVLNMKGTDKKVIFQGVHQLMGSDLGPKWLPGETKTSKNGFHRHRPAEGDPSAGFGRMFGIAFARGSEGRSSRGLGSIARGGLQSAAPERA